MPCSGDPTVLCGAGLRNSVYEIPPPPPTAAPTPAPVGVGNGPNFLGCFVDSGARRDMEYSAYAGPENSPEFCGALCREQGYTFFGLQYGLECACGNDYGSYGPADDPSECSMPCSGDPMILCGAGLRNSVYEIPPPPPTAAPTPAPVGVGNGPNFLGCFVDSGARRDMEYSAYAGPENSPEFCGALCREQGYTFFGLQYGLECACGNDYGSYGPADDPSECSMPCSGDPLILCGAGLRNSVYEIPPPPPTAAPTPAPVGVSNGPNFLGCFVDSGGEMCFLR
ncbi:unnamed protein product [Chrysoparadoxa australica]